MEVNLLDCFTFTTLNIEQYQLLIVPISDKEIIGTIKKMGKWKVLGPDGLHSGFYLDSRDVVGVDVISIIKGVFMGRVPLERYNHTDMDCFLKENIKLLWRTTVLLSYATQNIKS